MGTGASSNVKEIKIDQNDDNWERYSGSGRRRNSRGSAGSRALSAVADRVRRSANSTKSSNGSADRRLQQLRTALEATEKRAVDSENRVRQLEREVATLELRNQELADEVTWLKQQLTGRPEIPVPSRRPPSRPGTSSNDENDRMAKLHYQIRKYEQEIATLNTKFERENHILQSELTECKFEMGEQIRNIESQLRFVSLINSKLEDVIRKNLSDSCIQSCRDAAEGEMTSSSASTENGGMSANRAQLILDLSNQISEQKEKIRHLEEDIIKRDSEIGRLKDAIQSSAGDEPIGDILVGNGLPPKGNKKKHSISGPKGTNPATMSRTGSRQSFTAVKKPEGHNNEPMKVERRPDGKVDDEIEALLRTPEPTLQFESYDGPMADQLTLSSLTVGAVGTRKRSMIDEERITYKKENIRAVSVPKSSTVQHIDLTTLKDVYALNDTMEPIKVIETPRQQISMDRPRTAGTTRTQSPAVTQVKTFEDVETGATVQSFSVLGRGYSAPMLFKPSAPKKEAPRRRRKFYTKKVDETEMVSVLDDLETEREVTVQQETLQRKPPTGRQRADTDNSLHSSSSMDGANSDEELQDILNSSFSGRPSRPNTSHGKQFGSAKSRDSGFLGDSYVSDSVNAFNRHVHSLQTPVEGEVVLAE